MDKQKNIRQSIAVLCFYFLLALVVTFPLVFNINDHYINDHFLYDNNPELSEAGDGMFLSWVWSWETDALRTNPAELFNANIFYPNENTLAYSEHALGALVFFSPVYLATHNPVLAYNIVLLCALVLTAFTTYVLIRAYTRSTHAAIVGGVMYGFSIYRISHLAHAHSELIFALPLTLLCLYRYFQTHEWKYLWGAAGWFVFMSISNAHYMLMGGSAVIIMGASYVLGTRRSKKQQLAKVNKNNVHQFSQWTQIVFTSFAVLVIVFLTYKPYFSLRSFGAVRDLEMVNVFSAWLIDYIQFSPILRRLTESLVNAEHFLDLGLLFIALLIISAYVIHKSWFAKQSAKETNNILHRATIKGALGAALVAVILSLGPIIHANYSSELFPGPYYVLYKLIPGFDGLRALARFHMITTLALTIVIGYGLSIMFAQMKNNKQRNWTVVTLTILLLAESMLAANYPLRLFYQPDGEHIPSVYEYITSLPDDQVIFELPMFVVTDTTYSNNEVLHVFHSIHHRKKLVNGYSGYYTESYINLKKEFDNFPESEEGIYTVQHYGANYLVIDFTLVPLSDVRAIKKGLDNAPVLSIDKQFDSTMIYQIENPT